eukprot:scaffold4567_cov276-Chaetoceros_neogracile.AAC.17
MIRVPPAQLGSLFRPYQQRYTKGDAVSNIGASLVKRGSAKVETSRHPLSLNVETMSGANVGIF